MDDMFHFSSENLEGMEILATGDSGGKQNKCVHLTNGTLRGKIHLKRCPTKLPP